MTIFFKPSGRLNISADPSSLPQSVDGFNSTSDALARCKNLRVDLPDRVKTRDGSSKFNTTALAETLNLGLIEQGGYRYSFFGQRIYRDETSIQGSLPLSARWSALLYNAYNSTTESVFALNAKNRKRIDGSTVYEWGIDAPSSIPAIQAGAGTGLTGAYNVRYTYCRKTSSGTVLAESNPSSPAAAAVSLSNQSLSVSWTASTDSQVTHVRVYRTVAGGSTYYLDTDVAIGTTILDTTTADASLGAQAAYTHDRPPLGAFVAGPNFNGVCFIAKDNLLYYSLPQQPEYWPATYYIEVSPVQFSGKCLVFWNTQLYYVTKPKIYLIQGTSATTFFPFPTDAVTGAQGPQAALAVQGKGIFHVGADGIYLWNTGGDRNITQNDFQPIFRGETKNGMPGAGSLANAILHQFENKLYFGYPGEDDTYPKHWIVWNLDTDRQSYYTWDREICSLANDLQNGYLLAGDNAGHVWRLESRHSTHDAGTAISWELESKAFTLQTRAHFPRYVKYDLDVTAGATATGTMLLDDVAHQTHTVTGNRNTRQRLVDTGNGERMGIRLAGSGPVDIYAVEAE